MPDTAVALRFAGEMFHGAVVSDRLVTLREALMKVELGFLPWDGSFSFCRDVSGRYDLC